MTLLFIDTETTGRDPREARLVQLAGLLIEPRPPWLQVSSFNEIIRPEGWLIPEEAAQVHGISTERALAQGVPLHDALERFAETLLLDQSPTKLIAHNFQYDSTVLLAELSRELLDPEPWLAPKPFCTMRALTERCRLPSRYGKYKWPRLSEAYQFCFGHEPDEDCRGHSAHSAMGDVLSCRDIYLHGIVQGWWQ